MNILNIIKDCINNPQFTKDYGIEEYTLEQSSESQTITNESSFSSYSIFKNNKINTKLPLMDQKMLKLYMRVWTGLGRAIAKVTLEGNCFANLQLGYFFPLNDSKRKFAYSPTFELLESRGLTLIEDCSNIKPGDCDVLHNLINS